MSKSRSMSMEKNMGMGGPVLVTGGSGFVGSWVVRELLEHGYRVRTTVRGERGAYPYLSGLPGAGQLLELVQADLLVPGSFDAAVQGCGCVIHTASPYAINVADPQRDLVDPALRGTESVLEACLKAPSVRRVVVTSSIAAIADHAESGHVFTEADWNSLSTVTRQPYHYSKTMAERQAWELAGLAQGRFDLVTINPVMVTGPSLVPSLNTTNAMVRDIMNGVYPGVMDLNWSFVDVRDVARAHRLAVETPDARGRNICAAGELHMREIVSLLREHGYAGYRLPKLDLSGKAGTWLMRLLSYTQPRDTALYIRLNIGEQKQCDSSKIRQELGMSFIPAADSLLAGVADMVRWGQLRPPGRLSRVL